MPVLTVDARFRPVMTSDATGGMLLFSGFDLFTQFTSTWRLAFESALVRPERCLLATADSDRDGLAGCADPDCWSRCAPLCSPAAPCDPAAPRCGDGVCGPIEDYLICPGDCSTPP